jgi:hypothetical protein
MPTFLDYRLNHELIEVINEVKFQNPNVKEKPGKTWVPPDGNWSQPGATENK